VPTNIINKNNKREYILKNDTPNNSKSSEKKLNDGGAEIFEESKIKNQSLNPTNKMFLPLTKISLRE
jgi:hypothetical protein